VSFHPHDKEAQVPYEVVEPGARDYRGVIYRTLTEAMVAAGPKLEVWQLADDAAQTRIVRCWPDPEFEPAVDLEHERTARFVRENVGRAEREATAILADYSPVAPDRVHALVSLAWGRGFVAGFGAGAEQFVQLLERIAGGEKP
jgi:hypothetical protein